MKNLTSRDDDFFEYLPPRARKREGEHTKHGNDFPWNHTQRFLESRVGKDWDEIISEFVHADWVPVRHRHPSNLTDYNRVHANTFLNKDRDVCYYDWFGHRPQHVNRIKDAAQMVFYVHPTTKILCSFTPKKQPSRVAKIKKHNAQFMKSLNVFHQLLKIEGIWYEVKAKLNPLALQESWHRPRNEDDPLIAIEDIEQVKFTYRPANPVIITSKKELSRKALKKHGLENDPFDNGPQCKKCGGFRCNHYYSSVRSSAVMT